MNYCRAHLLVSPLSFALAQQKPAFSILTSYIPCNKWEYSALRHHFLSFESWHRLTLCSTVSQWDRRWGKLLLSGDWEVTVMGVVWKNETPAKSPDFKQASVYVEQLGNLSSNGEKPSVVKQAWAVLHHVGCDGRWIQNIQWVPLTLPWASLLDRRVFLQVKTSLGPFMGQNLFWVLRWMVPPDCWPVPPAADEHYWPEHWVLVIRVL